jgi:hypothetical protein
MYGLFQNSRAAAHALEQRRNAIAMNATHTDARSKSAGGGGQATG